ncbi:hypothetical protein E2542_SST19768 [Spatholobus suberectus]|nr:hypothetical protein E2542_SST19768 [Spatholobus suberectus]
MDPSIGLKLQRKHSAIDTGTMAIQSSIHTNIREEEGNITLRTQLRRARDNQLGPRREEQSRADQGRAASQRAV